MKSSTTPNTPNNSSKENPMDSGDLLKQIFDRYIEVHKGEPKVTSFKQFIDVIIKAEIKPLCKSQGKFSGEGDWRSAQKANFAGRGAKWVKLELEQIEPTLTRFEANGIDCTEYRAWTVQAGFAWIRYTGPRIENGVGQAAFEVRTGGSKDDHPKQLHYMYDNNLMDHIEELGGTPHALNLEAIAKAAEAVSDEDEAVSEVPVSDDTQSDVEAVEADEAIASPVPTSDDPAEWEAYFEGRLEAEGMPAELNDGDDDLFSSFED